MDKQSVRRRFIQGSLAAPVVLTASSASASAMTSFGRCLRNGAGRGLDAPRFFAEDQRADRWLRRRIWVDQLAHEGVSKGWFYEDPVRRRYVSVRPPHAQLPFGAAERPKGWVVTGRSKRWALVYFDHHRTTEYRHITLERPAGHSATTISCYSSFAPRLRA